MKPILFNTETVRAIQNGTKTVTRRVLKPQHLRVLDSPYHEEHPETPDKVLLEKLCEPSYHPSDILYVRETWQEVYETEFDVDGSKCILNIRDIISSFDDIPKVEAGISHNCTTASMEPRMKYYVFKASDIQLVDPKGGLFWRPSIHMPRKAARVFLRVTDVRVQRLKDVTEGDARAEGFDSRAEFIGAILKMYPDCTEESWMWVIEFERISKEEAMKNGS